MSGGRITKPGPTDSAHMVVTCTPDATSVEFFDYADEALDAARLNLHPTTSVYAGSVTHQGEHRVKGSSKHIAIMVEVDDELRRALAQHSKVRSRRDIAGLLEGLLAADLTTIREEYRASLETEVTQPDRAAQAAIDRAHRSIAIAQSGLHPDKPPSGGLWSPASCSTDQCMGTAVRGSNYCAPCRSMRSGHGL